MSSMHQFYIEVFLFNNPSLDVDSEDIALHPDRLGAILEHSNYL